MENDKIKSAEIIGLTENFVKAVKDSDKETIRQIISDKLKIEFKIIGNGSVQDFDENNLQRIQAYSFLLKTEPYVYILRKGANVVYETNTHWHLSETAFQSGFVRNTFSYERLSDNWKLNYLKTELRRFSRYNLKESFGGLLTWIIVKTYKIKWIISK